VTLQAGALHINSVGVAGVSGPLGNGGTFTINGGIIDNTSGAAKVVANVNPVVVGGDFSFSTPSGTSANNLTLPGTINLGGGERTITTQGAGVLTLPGIISDGALVKTGTGQLVLQGNNTYAGNLTVNTGTLRITKAPNPGNDASTVTIAATGATLDLTYTGTDKVGRLFIGDTQMAAGVYGTSATAIPQITGSGTLTVTTGPPFDVWITGTFANGQVPLGKQGPNDDSDNDGIPNLVEYAIAGQDPTVSNASIGSFTGGTLSFTKRAGTNGLSYAIQESTDLGGIDDWDEVSGASYVNNTGTISYTLTPGTPPKKFLRLQVLSD
jgi:autotransporter-associated beta strand protein